MDWLGAALSPSLETAPAQGVERVAGVPVAFRVLTAQRAELELPGAPPEGDAPPRADGPLAMPEPARERPFAPPPTHLSFSSLHELERAATATT